MGISEGIRKVFLAGVGAVATTGEAAKNLIDTLAQKGEATVEQGKLLNQERKKNVKEKLNRHVTVHVVNEFKDVYSAMNKMSREELDELKAKLDELTAEPVCAGEDECSCDSSDKEESSAAAAECCCGKKDD